MRSSQSVAIHSVKTEHPRTRDVSGAADPSTAKMTAVHGTHPPAVYPIDRPWVLCTDDDAEFLHGLKLKLQTRGYDVV